MALSADDQDFLDFALSSLPRWMNADDEFLMGAAKLFGSSVKAQTDYWFAQTLIETATGASSTTPDWLRQHARDRGTDRQFGEGDPALRTRIRNVADALTRGALLTAADAILAADVVGGPVGTPLVSPYGVAVSPDGARLYVCDSGASIVHVFESGAFLAFVTVGVGPVAAAVTPDGTHIYVANSGDFVNPSTVTVIRASDLTVTATINVGVSPQNVCVSPDGSHVYLLNYNAGTGTVSAIRTSDNTVIGTLAAGVNSQMMGIAPDGGHVYVSNNGGPGTVTVIETTGNTVSATISAGLSNPTFFAITSDSSRMYIGDSSIGSVHVINLITNAVTGSPIVCGSDPALVAIAPDDAHVYVGDIIDGTVKVIRTSDNTVIATVVIGDAPGVVIVSADNAHVYATTQNAATCAVIRTSDNTVIATPSVGAGPYTAAMTPDGSHVYIAGNVDNSVWDLTTSTDTAAAIAIPAAAGSAAMVELPRDGAHLGAFGTDTGTGGTFATFGASPGFQFTPTVPFAAPPYRDPTVVRLIQGYSITISGAAAPANNGTFTATALDDNAIVFANGSGVAGADAGAAWTINKLDRRGNRLSGHGRSFAGRGFRCSHGGRPPIFVLMLPYGTSAAALASIAEMLRQKKAAGILALVERRLTP